jgi:hypothetical protein
MQNPNPNAKLTLTRSKSITICTAALTSASNPWISKQLFLNTASTPVVVAICLRMGSTWEELIVGGGKKTSNVIGSSQKEAT